MYTTLCVATACLLVLLAVPSHLHLLPVQLTPYMFSTKPTRLGIEINITLPQNPSMHTSRVTRAPRCRRKITITWQSKGQTSTHPSLLKRFFSLKTLWILTIGKLARPTLTTSVLLRTFGLTSHLYPHLPQ